MQLARLWLDGRDTGLRLGRTTCWHERAIGLLLTPRLDDPVGLWINRCNAVHMLGMRYAIDVAFVDAQGCVLKQVHALRPMRMAACRGAAASVELRSGLVAALGIRPGCRLALNPEPK